MAATNPGTPATVSRKSILFNHSFSVRDLPLYHGNTFLYPLIISKLTRRLCMNAFAKLSPRFAGSKCVMFTYLTSVSVHTGWGKVQFSFLRISSLTVASTFFSSSVFVKLLKLWLMFRVNLWIYNDLSSLKLSIFICDWFWLNGYLFVFKCFVINYDSRLKAGERYHLSILD